MEFYKKILIVILLGAYIHMSQRFSSIEHRLTKMERFTLSLKEDSSDLVRRVNRMENKNRDWGSTGSPDEEGPPGVDGIPGVDAKDTEIYEEIESLKKQLSKLSDLQKKQASSSRSPYADIELRSFVVNEINGLRSKIVMGQGTPGMMGAKGEKGDKGDRGEPGKCPFPTWQITEIVDKRLKEKLSFNV